MVLFAGLVAAAEPIRESRLAMGTVVGVTIDAPADVATPAFDLAYAAIEAGEALLSEWRPGSVTARLVQGLEPPPEAVEVYTFCEDLRARTRGAFNVMWGGGELLRQGAAWSATGRVDLGGVLKGWLNDRAAAALRGAGVERFLIDAAGDVYAGGSWDVEVWGTERLATVHLQDQALSTSGSAGQPGHIVDARAGAPITGERVVSVVASRGMVADGLATAVYAGGNVHLAEGYGAVAMLVEGRRRFSRGGRRTFR